mgnify:CR=1 FL=1|jgi:hypothetical protein
MAGKRRKAPRKARKTQTSAVYAQTPETVTVNGSPPDGVKPAHPAMASPSASKRRKVRYKATPEAEAGAFLGPEQQYLLRKRREVEQRAAKQRRAVVGIVLAVVAAAAAGIWALLRA